MTVPREMASKKSSVKSTLGVLGLSEREASINWHKNTINDLNKYANLLAGSKENEERVWKLIIEILKHESAIKKIEKN